jgi:hypothetical protein
LIPLAKGLLILWHGSDLCPYMRVKTGGHASLAMTDTIFLDTITNKKRGQVTLPRSVFYY